jgi:hypothetical protein
MVHENGTFTVRGPQVVADLDIALVGPTALKPFNARCDLFAEILGYYSRFCAPPAPLGIISTVKVLSRALLRDLDANRTRRGSSDLVGQFTQLDWVTAG